MSLRAVPLLVAGGRHSWGRLLGLVVGVAVGCALFLGLWGASTGLQAREQRSAWLNQSSSGSPGLDGSQARLTDGTVLAATGSDFHAGAVITRLDLAVTPASAITLPDGSKPPAPGQYYASPALAELIASVPPAQLGDRYGTLVGALPDSIIASPDSLVAVVGQTAAELVPRATPMPSLAGQAYGGNNGYRVVAIIGSIALLLPVLLLARRISSKTSTLDRTLTETSTPTTIDVKDPEPRVGPTFATTHPPDQHERREPEAGANIHDEQAPTRGHRR